MNESLQKVVRCPACRSCLAEEGTRLVCWKTHCRLTFPIVDGVPILINESNSVFSIQSFEDHRSTTFRAERSGLERSIKKLLPRLGRNMAATRNLETFARLLRECAQRPRVLVIGGSTLGDGLATFAAAPDIEFVETDVTFGPRTQLICDSHDLPFEASSFEGVIIQAVLQCVVDPQRVVQEIHRVLSRDGIVYAEAPYMQQMVNAPYDFTRFTSLGLRRLFRSFEELASGITAGPGAALAWSCQFFFLSFTTSRPIRGVIRTLAGLSLWWLKYVDRFLVDRPGAYTAASGFYFLGRKSAMVADDREIIALCKAPY